MLRCSSWCSIVFPVIFALFAKDPCLSSPGFTLRDALPFLPGLALFVLKVASMIYVLLRRLRLLTGNQSMWVVGAEQHTLQQREVALLDGVVLLLTRLVSFSTNLPRNSRVAQRQLRHLQLPWRWWVAQVPIDFEKHIGYNQIDRDTSGDEYESDDDDDDDDDQEEE